MRQFLKRALALLMGMMLCASMLPGVALADEDTGINVESVVSDDSQQNTDDKAEETSAVEVEESVLVTEPQQDTIANSEELSSAEVDEPTVITGIQQDAVDENSVISVEGTTDSVVILSEDETSSSSETPQEIEITVTLGKLEDAQVSDGTAKLEAKATVTGDAEVTYIWQKLDTSIEYKDDAEREAAWSDVDTGDILKITGITAENFAEYAVFVYRCVAKAGDAVAVSNEAKLIANPAWDAIEEPVEETAEETIEEAVVALIAETSGDCGTNVFYTLSNLVLTISLKDTSIGTGCIADYSEGKAPWYSDRSDINSIVIDNGITGIGSWAFAGCNQVMTVTLGSDITGIGAHAFDECTKLTSISIFDKVTTIGDAAFKNCSALNGVGDMDGVTTIGTEAFAGTAITSIYFTKKIKSIGEGAFQNCIKLTSITVEEPSSDSDTDAARIYATVDGVLFNYDKDTLLAYPGGKSGAYTVPAGVAKIGENAFYGTAGVTAVTLDAGTTTIDSAAFESSSITALTVPSLGKLTTIGNDAFHGSSLQSFQVSSNLTSIGKAAFAGCASLTAFTIDAGNTSYQVKDGVLYSKNGDTLYAYPAGKTGAYIAVVTEGKNLTIVSAAFRGAESLSAVTLPADVTTVGDTAFSGCTGLQTVTIDKTVTTIGENAFNGCKTLSQVNYTGSQSDWQNISIGSGNDKLTGATISYDYTNAKVIDSGACGANASWTLDENGLLTISGSGAMTDYTEKDLTPWVDYEDKITSVKVLNGITSIGAYAFDDCDNLSSVTLADTVTKLGNFAFSYCGSLKEICLDESLSSIGSGVFRFSGLERYTVAINNSAYSAVDGVLFDKSGKVLESYPAAKSGDYAIPADCTTIDSLAFEYSAGLGTLTFGSDIVTVSADSFRYSSVKAYNVASGNEAYKAVDGVLYNYAGNCLISFPMGCGVTDYSISPAVTAISAYAFYGTTTLEIVRIPTTVTSIGRYAFTNCDKITKAIYAGSEAQWIGVSVDAGNELMTNHIMYHPDHDLKVEVTTEATCTKAGETTYTCTICGYSYSDNTKPAATGHNYVTDEGRDATYWSQGKTSGVKCANANCGDVQVEQKVVAQLIPAALTATRKSATSVTLKWNKISDAQGYVIWRKDGVSGEWKIIKTITKGTQLSAVDTGLVPGYAYYYRYTAYTTIAGTSFETVNSDETVYKTALNKPVLTVKKTDATHITIKWKSVSAATGYVLSISDGSGYRTLVTTIDPTVLTYTVEVAPNGTYYFKAIAYSEASGISVESPESTVKKIKMAFGKPSLTAKKDGAASVKLSWKTVAGATSYEVYTSTTSKGEYTKIWSGSALEYTLTVLPGSTYFYKIVAVSTAGGKTTYSNYSAARSVKIVFAAPTVKLVRNDASSVKLTWKEISGATSYEIWHTDVKGGEFTLLDTTNGLEYENDQLPGTTHYYKVRAVCTIAAKTVYSNYSKVRNMKLKMTAPVLTLALTAVDQIAISWKEIEGVTGYRVYMSDTKTFECTDSTLVYEGTDLQTLVSSLNPGLHYIKMVAYVELGEDTATSAITKVKTIRTY